MAKQTKGFYEFGKFRIDPEERLLLRDGQVVPLTSKVYDILLVLVQNSGHLLDKESLMNAVWPDSFVEEGNLTRNVSTLRQVLGQSPGKAEYIQTIPRRGYRFVAPVREVNDKESVLVIKEQAGARVLYEEGNETGEERGETGQPPEQERMPQASLAVKGGGGVVPFWGKIRRFALPTLILAILAVGGVGLYPFALATLILAILAVGGVELYWLARRDKVTGRLIDSVAVLPFANASANPDAEYLSDGITESLINSLSQLPRLRVLARSTVFRYKGKEVDPQQVGHGLDVRAAVTGRVRQRGDTLIIAAELIDVEKGVQLWGGHYRRKLADIFATQEEISQEISEKLRLRLTGEEQNRLTKRHTEDPAAYQAYLKGRYFWNKRTGVGLKKGIEYFNQAIEKDPGYALAYAGLADCYDLLNFYIDLPPSEALPRAKAAAIRALEMDDTLAEAHTSLAYARFLYYWDWPGAESEFKRAIELNPNYPTAHQWYAYYLAGMGRCEEATAVNLRAQELDPLSLMINTGVGVVFYYARQYDRAIEPLRKTLELNSNFPHAHRALGDTYREKGMFGEAIAELQKAVTLLSGGNREYLGRLGNTYAVSGQRGEALRVLGQLRELSQVGYVSPVSFALVYIGLGEKDQAFAWLEKAYEERSTLLTQRIKVDPIYDSLRSDPRFQDLLRHMKLAP
jgi:TolB-like protein/DNA-binding winged helix-turn-helix (wHTH) protein/Flp pilus assembly protein TadD